MRLFSFSDNIETIYNISFGFSGEVVTSVRVTESYLRLNHHPLFDYIDAYPNTTTSPFNVSVGFNILQYGGFSGGISYSYPLSQNTQVRYNGNEGYQNAVGWSQYNTSGLNPSYTDYNPSSGSDLYHGLYGRFKVDYKGSSQTSYSLYASGWLKYRVISWNGLYHRSYTFTTGSPIVYYSVKSY